jgi:hypothetical protein
VVRGDDGDTRPLEPDLDVLHRGRRDRPNAPQHRAGCRDHDPRGSGLERRHLLAPDLRRDEQPVCAVLLDRGAFLVAEREERVPRAVLLHRNAEVLQRRAGRADGHLDRRGRADELHRFCDLNRRRRHTPGRDEHAARREREDQDESEEEFHEPMIP